MMKRRVLVALIMLAPSVRASGRKPSELREMLSTRSVAELESKSRETSARKLTRDTCTAELAARLLPRACFHETVSSAQTRRLTSICIQNAKRSRSRLDLSGSLEDLPPECRRTAGERLEDLQYIDEAISPETSVMRTLGPEIEEISRD